MQREITLSTEPTKLSGRYQLVIGSKVVFLTKIELQYLKTLVENVK